MSHAGLKKRWKYHVTTQMKKAHREGLWRFPLAKSFLKQYPNFASILNKLWHVTWYAHIGASLLDPRFSVQYIGRYTKRAVMAEYRIRYYDGKLIRFSFKDYAEGGKTSYMTLKVMTFIGRIIRHIPDKHFPMIRYAGLFSNRWKQKYLSQSRTALNHVKISDPAPYPKWPERQTEYRGVDPLVCPNCNNPLILVGFYFGSWKSVQDHFDRAGKTVPYSPGNLTSVLLQPG